MVIRAGRLRHRVQLEVKAEDVVLGSRTTAEWAPETALWARVRPLSGRELESAQQIVAEASHEVQCWYDERVTEGKRFLLKDRGLEIEHVANVDERDEELLCICVERK